MTDLEKQALLTKLRDEVEGLDRFDIEDTSSMYDTYYSMEISAKGIYLHRPDVLALLEKAGE